MRIPEIAEEMRKLAAERGVPELVGLADELRRRQPGARAPATSRPMTDELAAEIRAFAGDHPNLSQAAIGRRFNVNPGRVSEALNGKRS